MKRTIILRITRIVISITLIIMGFLVFSSMCPNTDARTERTIGYRDSEYKSSELWYIGNSNMKSGIIPDIVYNQTGLIGYNSGEAYMSMQRLLNVTKDFYNYQNPKLIIFETDVLIDCVDDSQDDNLHFYDGPIQRFYHNHDFWRKSIQTKRIKSHHGYNMKQSTMDAANKADYKDKNVQIEFCDKNKALLDQFLSIANEHETKVLFVSLPATKHGNKKSQDGIKEYLSQNDEVLIDFSDFDRAGLDRRTCMADNNHINFKAAYKVSKYIGNYIKDNYEISTNCEHQQFDNEVKKFNNKYCKNLK